MIFIFPVSRNALYNVIHCHLSGFSADNSAFKLTSIHMYCIASVHSLVKMEQLENDMHWMVFLWSTRFRCSSASERIGLNMNTEVRCRLRAFTACLQKLESLCRSLSILVEYFFLGYELCTKRSCQQKKISDVEYFKSQYMHIPAPCNICFLFCDCRHIHVTLEYSKFSPPSYKMKRYALLHIMLP